VTPAARGPAEIQREIAALSAELYTVLEPVGLPASPRAEPAPAWLSVDGFAARLKVSRRSVYRLMDAGMPYEIVSGRGRSRKGVRRIPVALAEAWIAAQAAAERAARLDASVAHVR
jgi:hypothetical protein